RHSSAPLDGVFSPDGRSLATISADGVARIWDLSTAEQRVLPGREVGAVSDLVFRSGGRLLVARYADETRRMWDLSGPEPILRRKIIGLVVSENGHWLVAVDTEHIGRVWDVMTEQTVGPPLELGPGMKPAAVSGDGGRVAFLSPDHTLHVWDVA